MFFTNVSILQLYLKLGKSSNYDYIASTEKNVGLRSSIDSIIENMETHARKETENGIFFEEAIFAGDATRFMLNNEG